MTTKEIIFFLVKFFQSSKVAIKHFTVFSLRHENCLEPVLQESTGLLVESDKCVDKC